MDDAARDFLSKHKDELLRILMAEGKLKDGAANRGIHAANEELSTLSEQSKASHSQLAMDTTSAGPPQETNGSESSLDKPATQSSQSEANTWPDDFTDSEE